MQIWKSKTFWAGVSGIVAAVGGWATGEMSVGAALQTSVTAVMGIFMRFAIGKIGNEDAPPPPVLDGVTIEKKSAPVKTASKMPEGGGA